MRIGTNAQLAHVWAQQAHNSTESGTCSNYYFVGATIYSYGEHFPVARHTPNGVTLITTKSYSSTTERHVALARHAASHRNIFKVANVLAIDKAEHRKNHDALIIKIKENAKKLSRRRKNLSFWFAQHCDEIRECNKYAAVFKLNRKPLEMPENAEAYLEEYRSKDKLEKAIAIKSALADCELWRTGESNKVPTVKGLPVMLRMLDDETVETSMRAVFPASHARAAWKIIKQVKESGEAWVRDSHVIRVGHFQIDSISATGKVKAGCHIIKFSEIARFAESQGW